MSQEDDPPFPQSIGNWWLGRDLGSGYSGTIFKAQHIHTKQIVALKVQHVDHECPTNRYERRFYPLLQGGMGMPTLWAAGVEGCWDYLAIDLLGASLDHLYRTRGGPAEPLDLGSVCCIAMQMIARLELMHARGILHRDIQLGNTVVGQYPNDSTLYMIDFGFSKLYIDPQTRRHIPDSNAKRDFIGNYWFSSVNVHCRGKVPSRRDDLEASALMFIHLLTPHGLPWTRNGVPKTDAAETELKEQKRSARSEDLCRNLPVEFEEFLRYSRSLKFAEQPDYQRWIEEFRALKIEEGYGPSDKFIWPPPNPHKPEAGHIPRRMRMPGLVRPDAMAGILNDLTNLDLARTNVVLGECKNMDEAAGRDSTATMLSRDSTTGARERTLATKAQRLTKLAAKVPSTTDNVTLSGLVREFIEVMKSNSGRTLTKEGFFFLDALYEQLADPSDFTTPLRTSRHHLQAEEKEPAHIKLGVVARLKNEVGTARSKKELAAMVAGFGKVTNRSTGRTITKDGFGFLEGVAARLMVLR